MMRLNLAFALLLLLLLSFTAFIELFVPITFLLVKVLNKGLDIRDFVLAYNSSSIRSFDRRLCLAYRCNDRGHAAVDVAPWMPW